MLALLPTNHRREKNDFRIAWQCENAANDLLTRLSRDRIAAARTVPVGDTREEDSQVIVNFGDRADGGPRIRAGGLLRDRNRGTQTADVVHIGLGHLPKELPREA